MRRLAVAVQARSDGRALVAWVIRQADGLVAWRHGDQQAGALAGIALHEVAWTPTGRSLAP